jgi:hypothetical protein
MHVRPANPSDVPQTVFLWYERIALLQQTDSYFALLPSAREVWAETALQWIADDDVGFFVAEVDGSVVGYMVVTIVDGPVGLRPKKLGKLIDMGLDLHQSHRGLGGVLLDTVKVWLSEQKLRVLTVDLPLRYPVEEAFWRSQGAKARFNEYWMLI